MQMVNSNQQQQLQFLSILLLFIYSSQNRKMKAFQPKAQTATVDTKVNPKSKTSMPPTKTQPISNTNQKDQSKQDDHQNYHINLPTDNLNINMKQNEVDLKKSSAKSSARKRQSKIFEAPKSQQGILQSNIKKIIQTNNQNPLAPAKCSRAIFGVIALFIFASLTAILMIALFANHQASKPLTFNNLYSSFLQPLYLDNNAKSNKSPTSPQPVNTTISSTSSSKTSQTVSNNKEDGIQTKPKTTSNNTSTITTVNSTTQNSNNPSRQAEKTSSNNLRTNMQDINTLKVHKPLQVAKQ